VSKQTSTKQSDVQLGLPFLTKPLLSILLTTMRRAGRLVGGRQGACTQTEPKTSNLGLGTVLAPLQQPPSCSSCGSRDVSFLTNLKWTSVCFSCQRLTVTSPISIIPCTSINQTCFT